MRVEKRTLNWLPRPSLYKEAEIARIKRRHYAQQTMADQQQISSAFSGVLVASARDQVNLTFKVAHSRLVSKKV